MITNLICLAIGLFVGWVLVPAPQAVNDFWARNKPW